ncbi:hypothetical protein ASPZODRAFT_126762, partial [Penicilliopsis zonata CBS 506.65]
MEMGRPKFSDIRLEARISKCREPERGERRKGERWNTTAGICVLILIFSCIVD